MAATVVVVPAIAHEEVPGVTNVLDTIEPAPPAGITIQVTRSVADQVAIENTTTEDLEVLGDDGQPFLRIGPRGVEANLSSPDWYRSNTPEGAAPVPASAAPNSPPKWEPVSAGSAWGWFDHRLHRQALTRVPTAAPGQSVTLERWVIPMRHGGRDFRLTGRRLYSRPAGAFRHEVVGQIPGTQAAVLQGRVPAIFLRVEEPKGELILLGEGGEPFARFARGSVEVNAVSPTWALTARSRGRLEPAPLPRSGRQPDWEPEGPAPQLTWLEPRAMPARDGVDFEWEVPARRDGEEVVLRGRSVWEPAPAGPDKGGAPESRSRFPAWVPGLVMAMGGLGAIAAAALSRRARARRAGR